MEMYLNWIAFWKLISSNRNGHFADEMALIRLLMIAGKLKCSHQRRIQFENWHAKGQFQWWTYCWWYRLSLMFLLSAHKPSAHRPIRWHGGRRALASASTNIISFHFVSFFFYGKYWRLSGRRRYNMHLSTSQLGLVHWFDDNSNGEISLWRRYDDDRCGWITWAFIVSPSNSIHYSTMNNKWTVDTQAVSLWLAWSGVLRSRFHLARIFFSVCVCARYARPSLPILRLGYFNREPTRHRLVDCSLWFSKWNYSNILFVWRWIHRCESNFQVKITNVRSANDSKWMISNALQTTEGEIRRETDQKCRNICSVRLTKPTKRIEGPVSKPQLWKLNEFCSLWISIEWKRKVHFRLFPLLSLFHEPQLSSHRSHTKMFN